MEKVTFIVFFNDGRRETISTHYNENLEHEVDAAWDYINSMYPEATYIEKF